FSPPISSIFAGILALPANISDMQIRMRIIGLIFPRISVEACELRRSLAVGSDDGAREHLRAHPLRAPSRAPARAPTEPTSLSPRGTLAAAPWSEVVL